jgi:DNA-binding response OmpR family regulator
MAQESERPIQSAAESDLHFGPFRLERNKSLWHGEHLVALRPRALAVLRYLAERPGQLVTTEGVPAVLEQKTTICCKYLYLLAL